MLLFTFREDTDVSMKASFSLHRECWYQPEATTAENVTRALHVMLCTLLWLLCRKLGFSN